MIATIKHILFTGWHIIRWVRLGLGIIIAVQAIQNHDPLSGFMAAFLLFQAVTNTGCCGVNGCAVAVSKDLSEKPVDADVKELK